MVLLGVLAMTGTLPITGFGEVPQQVNYQGQLTDDVGNPLDSNYVMVFSIYDVPNGGTALWWEEQTITVDNGMYDVHIGQDPTSNSFPTDLFEGQRWLGVTVGADAEMTPRQLLTAVPFAFKAEDADTVGGWSSIAGGRGNIANNNHTTVSGGDGNTASNAYDSVVEDVGRVYVDSTPVH